MRLLLELLQGALYDRLTQMWHCLIKPRKRRQLRERTVTTTIKYKLRFSRLSSAQAGSKGYSIAIGRFRSFLS